MATNGNRNSAPSAELVTYTFHVSQNEKQTAPDSVTVTFDFTGVSRGALMTEAMRNIAIRIQGKMRSLPTRKENPVKWADAVKQYNGKKIVVADALSNTRVRTSPAQKIAKVAASAGKNDIAAAIAMLQAQLTETKGKTTRK